MKSAVLLIGGNGFIGSHLVDAFLAQGHEVRVLDPRMERFRAPLAGVRYFTGDYSDLGLLAQAVRGCDCVVHLAHQTAPVTSVEHPDREILNSVFPFVAMMSHFRDNPIRRLIYVSSGGAIYGNADQARIDETVMPHPISPYGVAKLTVENYLYMFSVSNEFQYAILRPSNVYGPRQNFLGRQGLISVALHRLLSGERLDVWGDGQAVKDYLYVGDLATAAVALAAQNCNRTVYNVGSGSGASVNDVIAACARAAGVEAQVDYRPAHAFDVKRFILDSSRLRAATGWKPQVELADGIRRTGEWIRDEHARGGGSPA